MRIEEIVTLVENRLSYLRQHRAAAYARGDAEAVDRLDDEIITTQATLDQLKRISP